MRIKTIKIGAAIIGLVVSLCILFSCHKSQPSWDTQILAPIVNATLSINDIITSKYITSNPADSSVSLVYTDSLYNLNMDTLLTIPDTVLTDSLLWTFPSYTVTPGSVLWPPKEITTTYPIGSVELTEGILQSGYFVFTVKNHLPQMADYYYKVYNVQKVRIPWNSR